MELACYGVYVRVSCYPSVQTVVSVLYIHILWHSGMVSPYYPVCPVVCCTLYVLYQPPPLSSRYRFPPPPADWRDKPWESQQSGLSTLEGGWGFRLQLRLRLRNPRLHVRLSHASKLSRWYDTASRVAAAVSGWLGYSTDPAAPRAATTYRHLPTHPARPRARFLRSGLVP